MFSDLVGSTELSARMDPEDLREVISVYQKCVAETVGRLGGFVAKYMGDGVLVYFGYPSDCVFTVGGRPCCSDGAISFCALRAFKHFLENAPNIRPCYLVVNSQ